MQRMSLVLLLAAAPFVGVTPPATGGESRAPIPGTRAVEWHMNATIIEACSCPMFCQCYFDTKPAAHPGCCPPGTDPKLSPRYCRFNHGFLVNRGTFGTVKLDGARFWMAGDLGGDFTQG